MGTGEQLARLIKQSRMSQVELSQRLGVTDNWVNNRANGVVRIRADEIPPLARELGVSPLEFFADVRPPGGWGARGDETATPYAEAFIEGFTEDLPLPERTYIRGIFELRRRFRDQISERSEQPEEDKDPSQRLEEERERSRG